VKKVVEIVGVSERQIWRLVAEKAFPKQVYVGHSARWSSLDIQAYLDELKRRRHD